MLKFICPICEIETDETELTPGGEAHLKRMGPGSSDQNFYTYPIKPMHFNFLFGFCLLFLIIVGSFLQDNT